VDIVPDHCVRAVGCLWPPGLHVVLEQGLRPLGEEAATLEVTGFAPPDALATQAVEVLDGDIGLHAQRLIAVATSEVCVVATMDMVWDIPRTCTGARWRALLPREAPVDAAGMGPDSSELRTIDDPPLGAFIVDRMLALMPAGRPGDGAVTLLVHPGGLLQALQALFERTWNSADHPASGLTGKPCPEDLRLLRLLVGGFTDETIASRLDVGARTVQRRVHDLIVATGVRTRLQLIWHATRRGWI
jgi:hypothetical protein